MSKNTQTMEERFDEKFQCDCPSEEKHYAFDMDGKDILAFIREEKKRTAEELLKDINSKRQNVVLESGHVHQVVFGVDLNKLKAKYQEGEV